MARRPAGRGQVSAAVLVTLLLLPAGGTAPARVSGALTCEQVVGYLTPCISYAMGRATAPGQACCAGIKSLEAAAGTAADRQDTCACLKRATASMGTGAPNPDLVAGIPNKCGVAVPYPISRTVDCSKVK